MTMSEAERVKLLDAAMRSGAPEAYLAGIQKTLEEANRDVDATMAASIRLLYRAGEIEVLMSMRAEWSGLRSLTQPPSAMGF